MRPSMKPRGSRCLLRVIVQHAILSSSVSFYPYTELKPGCEKDPDAKNPTANVGRHKKIETCQKRKFVAVPKILRKVS